MKKILITAALFIFFITSCDKENGAKETFCTDGYIYWGGDPAVDGKGWYFSTRTTRDFEYPLKAIADSLKTDSLPVNLCLQKTGEQYACNCTKTYYYYELISATKK